MGKSGELHKDWEGDGMAGVSFSTDDGGRVFICHPAKERGFPLEQSPADWELARLLKQLYDLHVDSLEPN